MKKKLDVMGTEPLQGETELSFWQRVAKKIRGHLHSWKFWWGSEKTFKNFYETHNINYLKNTPEDITEQLRKVNYLEETNITKDTCTRDFEKIVKYLLDENKKRLVEFKYTNKKYTVSIKNCKEFPYGIKFDLDKILKNMLIRSVSFKKKYLADYEKFLKSNDKEMNDSYFDKAEEEASPKLSNLTDGEKCAINIYTGPSHGDINGFLKGRHPYKPSKKEAYGANDIEFQNEMREVMLHSAMIMSGLNKCPDERCSTSWRYESQMSPEKLNKRLGAIQSNKPIHEFGFLSTSTVKPLMTSSNYFRGDIGIKFIDVVGKDISSISNIPSEREFLATSGQIQYLYHEKQSRIGRDDHYFIARHTHAHELLNEIQKLEGKPVTKNIEKLVKQVYNYLFEEHTHSIVSLLDDFLNQQIGFLMIYKGKNGKIYNKRYINTLEKEKKTYINNFRKHIEEICGNTDMPINKKVSTLNEFVLNWSNNMPLNLKKLIMTGQLITSREKELGDAINGISKKNKWFITRLQRIEKNMYKNHFTENNSIVKMKKPINHILNITKKDFSSKLKGSEPRRRLKKFSPSPIYEGSTKDINNYNIFSSLRAAYMIPIITKYYSLLSFDKKESFKKIAYKEIKRMQIAMLFADLGLNNQDNIDDIVKAKNREKSAEEFKNYIEKNNDMKKLFTEKQVEKYVAFIKRLDGAKGLDPVLKVMQITYQLARCYEANNLQPPLNVKKVLGKDLGNKACEDLMKYSEKLLNAVPYERKRFTGITSAGGETYLYLNHMHKVLLPPILKEIKKIKEFDVGTDKLSKKDKINFRKI